MRQQNPKIIEVLFYKTAGGKEPVRDWMLRLDKGDLLNKDGVLNQAQAEAAKRVIAWQVKKMMESQHISKAQLARDLETSRGAVDRILDSENTSMTLKGLGAIADLFGKRLEINLVDV